MPEVAMLQCDMDGCVAVEGTTRYAIGRDGGVASIVILCAEHGLPVERLMRAGLPAEKKRRMLSPEYLRSLHRIQ